jgi:hypothetical protein
LAASNAARLFTRSARIEQQIAFWPLLPIGPQQDIIESMRLFHFSDDPSIKTFTPRPVRVQTNRANGQEWLNGPLVWAIDEEHDFLYLFPRECPRILIWGTPDSTEHDRKKWLQGHRAIAFIEADWLDQMRNCTMYRYEMPSNTFETLFDAGMWISRSPVTPICCSAVSNLQMEFAPKGVKLVSMETLASLKSLWQTSLHVSGIRLRNARM